MTEERQVEHLLKHMQKEKYPTFFLIQIQDIGNTAYEGLMNNSRNVYKEKSVGYSV